MSRVLVKYRGRLASLAGAEQEDCNAADVGDILKSIEKKYSKEAEKTARTMLIAVNGESIHLLKRYRTVLKEGDEVSFFPICAGG